MRIWHNLEKTWILGLREYVEYQGRKLKINLYLDIEKLQQIKKDYKLSEWEMIYNGTIILTAEFSLATKTMEQ